MSDKNSKENNATTTGSTSSKFDKDVSASTDADATDVGTPNDQPIPPSPAASVSTQHDQRVSSSTPNKSGRGLSIFAVLLSLIAMAGAGFTWYQTQVEQVRQESTLSVGVSEIGGQISRLGDAMTRLQNDQADVVGKSQLTTELLQLKTELQNQDQQLLAQQSQLQSAFSTIAEDLKKGVRDYAIEEVSQLLRLANNSLVFSGDIDSAERALSLADNQLKGLNDPRFGPVRVLINEELTELRNTQRLDVAQLSASLAGVAELVPSLPLENEPESYSSEADAEAVDTDMSFSGQLRQVWKDILGAVTIQRVDQPPKPLLAPEQRYFLNQNIQLALAKAELAALQKSPSVYQRSIDSATTWLRDYFDLSDPQVGEVLAQLDALRKQKIQTQVPDISRSYQALQSVIGRS